MRINLYAQQKNTIVINGVSISSFAEGDWMEIKQDGNAAERTKGGDGPAISISTSQGGTIGISLNPVSPALGTLYAMRNLQITNPSLFTIVLMTGVEEVIVAYGCAFGDMPQFTSGGEKMSPRKFTFECQKISPDIADVESIIETVAGSLITSAIGSLL